MAGFMGAVLFLCVRGLFVLFTPKVIVDIVLMPFKVLKIFKAWFLEQKIEGQRECWFQHNDLLGIFLTHWPYWPIEEHSEATSQMHSVGQEMLVFEI